TRRGGGSLVGGNVDVQAQQCATRRGQVFHAQQVESQRLDGRCQQVGDFHGFFSHRSPPPCLALQSHAFAFVNSLAPDATRGPAGPLSNDAGFRRGSANHARPPSPTS